MHPSVVGLPCRLVLMAAPPGFPVDQPYDRQAPRAPLPQSGVTSMGKTSCAFSKGITLSSSLVRTHAPNLYPPSDFGLPLFERSLQVAASPCCVKALPNAISVVLPYVPGPLLQLLPRCCLPFLPLGHWPSPYEQRVGAWRPCHHSYFGWRVLLELQSFLYVPAHRFVRLTGSSYPYTSQYRAAETSTAAHITVGCLPRAAAMLTIQTGQLMVRGLTPLRSDRLVGYSVRKGTQAIDRIERMYRAEPDAPPIPS